MAIRVPPHAQDDQEYYPLHEEDDVPETPPHELAVRYARDAISVLFPDWFVTGNACVYWERGNTRAYRAPDLFVVKDPLVEAVTRVYLLWMQPPINFVLEVGSRTTFRQDVGPKVDLYQEKVKAVEYCHIDLDHAVKRLWRMGPNGYEVVDPEPNGRLRSEELGLEIDLEDGLLRLYTLTGERLLTHEEAEVRRQEAERQRAEEARLRQRAERQRSEEARLRQEAEQQRAEEARLRQDAEARAADLARRLAELEARLADQNGGEA